MISPSAFSLVWLVNPWLSLCGHTIPSGLPCLRAVCRVCKNVQESSNCDSKLAVVHTDFLIFPCFNMLYFAHHDVYASSSGFGGSVTSTLQRNVRAPWHGMCAKLPSVSAFLHELAALVLHLRSETALGFEEAQRGVRETLPRHFLREVIKGALSWSFCPRNIPKR